MTESEQGVFQAVEELDAVDDEGQVSFITFSSIIPRETLNVDRYKAVILESMRVSTIVRSNTLSRRNVPVPVCQYLSSRLLSSAVGGYIVAIRSDTHIDHPLFRWTTGRLTNAADIV